MYLFGFGSDILIYSNSNIYSDNFSSFGYSYELPKELK